MLKRLYDYALNNNLDFEPGFKPKDVKWAIACGDSEEPQVISLGEGKRGLEFTKCPEFNHGELKKGGELKSHFLVEAAKVVALLGVKGESKEDKNTQKKHEYFIRLLEEASSEMPELACAARVLKDPEQLKRIQQQLTDYKARPTDNVTLMIDGDFPVESDQWHDWWRSFKEIINETKKQKEEPLMRCMITGKLVEPAATHPQITGLSDVGGTTSGGPLIGFNQDAFRSFGLKKSRNAAVSTEAASAYRAALNKLIRENSKRLGLVKIVYWFSQQVVETEDPLSWLIEGDSTREKDAHQRARDLLDAIGTGKTPSLGSNRYYVLSLSGAAGRIMVRDWMEGQFEELVSNIDSWFTDLAMVRPDGQNLMRNPRFSTVLEAMLIRNNQRRQTDALEELPSPFIARMWRVALRNEPFPFDVLAKTLARWRSDLLSEKGVNGYCAAVIKAYLNRKERRKGGKTLTTPYLNENHPEPAYHCGRLMAVLAHLQQSALGDVGAGVVQRYYAAASTTPALVLGRLTRTSQHHLDKLEPGLAYWYETKLASIWGKLKDNVPTTLTLEQQSLFALGYYQQMADLRTKRNSSEQKGEVDGE